MTDLDHGFIPEQWLVQWNKLAGAMTVVSNYVCLLQDLVHVLARHREPISQIRK